MPDIKETKKLLDEINTAVQSYDPILKEQARDILLKQAFGTETKDPKPRDAGTSPFGSDKPSQMAFHELVEKWTPTTHAEWALLGAYYVQTVQGNKDFTAFQVNKELKQHGTTVTNITVALEENISAEPALVRQIAKVGKSKQARKKYIMTTQGIKVVKDKLNGKE